MARLAESNFELARLFEKVDKPMKGIKVDVQEVMEKALEGSDLKSEDLDFLEGSMEDLVTLFRPTQAVGPNMLNVNIGDKQYVYEVDPDLFKAIQGLNVEDIGIVMKILSFPASTLRAGATLSPDFAVRNPIKDQFTSYVYSTNGFVPGVDLVKGMFELFSKGDVYNLWKAGGGEYASFVSLDRYNTQNTLKQVLASHGAQSLKYIKNPIEMLRLLSEFGEAGTRLGEMKRALERGKDPVQSAYDARNVTLDFAHLGTATRAFNMILAFFGAGIRSTATMVYNFKTRPMQTLFKSLLSITLPSILLYMVNRDDERWKEIPQWQKDYFWILMTDKHVYRISKPFDLGMLFGSIPERILEVMETKDPYMFDELKNTIIGGFAPGYIPTGLIPIIENTTNHNFFLDRPIISRGKENLPPEQQYGPYTTEVSKLLGEALGSSPAKIDNLIHGYSAGLGKYATQGLDTILKSAGITHEPPEPAKTLDQLPIIKAFMIREPIGSGSESVNRVYDMYKKTNAQMNYVKDLVKKGEQDKAKQYLQDHPDTVQAIILSATVSSFSEMNKAVDQIRESRDLTPQEKQKRIQQIGILQTNTARKVLDSLKDQPEEKPPKTSLINNETFRKMNIFNPPKASAKEGTGSLIKENGEYVFSNPIDVRPSDKEGYVKFYYPSGAHSEIKEGDVPKYSALLQKNFDFFKVGKYPASAPDFIGARETSPLTPAQTQRTIATVPEQGKKSATNTVPLIEKALQEAGIYNKKVLAYALATTQHETANSMAPVNEGHFNDEKYGYEPGFTGRSEARKRKYGGGEDYYGRGFIQITGKSNYAIMSKKVGVDLVKNPELANDPEIASKILAIYMRDRGTAKLINEGKIIEARKTINNDNKGKMIRDTTTRYLKTLSSI